MKLNISINNQFETVTKTEDVEYLRCLKCLNVFRIGKEMKREYEKGQDGEDKLIREEEVILNLFKVAQMNIYIPQCPVCRNA